MRKIANFLVDKRLLLFIVSIIVAIASLVLMNFVTVNKDMTEYLPKDSDMSKGLDIMESILGLYIRKGGFALQFNVVSPDMLREAQINPEQYKNLQVRLCGWNVYFNDLEREVQNYLIEGMANV